MIMGAGFLLVLLTLAESITAGFYTHIVGLLPRTVHLTLIRLLNNLASFMIVTALFTLIFSRLPRTRVPWRDALTGALITAVLFTLGRLVMNLYIVNSRLIPAYGPAGSVVVILIWFYYSAQIFYLGAEFTCVLSRDRQGRE
jgi:membrane protein